MHLGGEHAVRRDAKVPPRSDKANHASNASRLCENISSFSINVTAHSPTTVMCVVGNRSISLLAPRPLRVTPLTVSASTSGNVDRHRRLRFLRGIRDVEEAVDGCWGLKRITLSKNYLPQGGVI